jgi:hypothetical protein
MGLKISPVARIGAAPRARAGVAEVTSVVFSIGTTILTTLFLGLVSHGIAPET